MKRSILVLVICLFLVCFVAASYRIQTVGADSGFDSSYDSGGSSSSDSDGGGGGIIYLIYLCIEYPPLGIAVVTILLIVYLSNNKKKKEVLNKSLNSKLELLDVSKFPIEKQLEIAAFNIYKKIQFAWMNFDEDMIRECTTDEMYNMYLMQLDTLKVKNQKNIMYDIKYIGSNVVNRHEENGQETITMNMQVSCYDFIIDTRSNKIVRGNASKLNIYNYELTFVKSVGEKKLDICPRCGAPVEGNNSGVCEYCKSTLINSEYTLVMSKKKMLSQK